MFLLQLQSFCLLSLLIRVVLSGNIFCDEFQPIQASLSDCKIVIKLLERESHLPGMDKPKMWGFGYQSNDTHVQLPVGFNVRPFFPWKERVHCEFYVTTRRQQEFLTDVFTYEALTLTSDSILEQCYPRQISGYGFPSSQANVLTTPRYWVGNEMSTEVELGESDGYTLIMTAYNTSESKLKQDPSLTS